MNPRPPEPHSGALPDCATSRNFHFQDLPRFTDLLPDCDRGRGSARGSPLGRPRARSARGSPLGRYVPLPQTVTRSQLQASPSCKVAQAAKWPPALSLQPSGKIAGRRGAAKPGPSRDFLPLPALLRYRTPARPGYRGPRGAAPGSAERGRDPSSLRPVRARHLAHTVTAAAYSGALTPPSCEQQFVRPQHAARYTSTRWRSSRIMCTSSRVSDQCAPLART